MAKDEQYYVVYGRIAFCELAEPKEQDNGSKKYQLTLLIDRAGQNSQGFKDLKVGVAEAFDGKFGSKWADDVKAGRLRYPLRSGDEKADKYESFAGKLYLNCNSIYPPTMVDQKLNGIPYDKIESVMYPGAWVNVELTAYAYDQKGNRGVAFGLRSLQKVRDDEQFTRRRPISDVFKPIEADASDTDEEFDPLA
jgi:hypothetical protein